jgi:hypothetical protein
MTTYVLLLVTWVFFQSGSNTAGAGPQMLELVTFTGSSAKQDCEKAAQNEANGRTSHVMHVPPGGGDSLGVELLCVPRRLL